MQAAQIAAIQDCAHRSQEGTISFGEVVQKLASVGVERYHADYSRGETTYYLLDGESMVITACHSHEPIAEAFQPAAVEAAIRQSQRGEIVYRDFVKLTKQAGCIGYFVQITGRHVLYFGRQGDFHCEPFPTAKS